MAKAKTRWEWRGKSFESEAHLLAYLKQRALETIEGPPIDEASANGTTHHSVKVKIQVSLGKWPPKTRNRPVVEALPSSGKAKKLKTLPPIRVKPSEREEYF